MGITSMISGLAKLLTLRPNHLSDQEVAEALAADRAALEVQRQAGTASVTGAFGLWLPVGQVNGAGAHGRRGCGAVCWAVMPLWGEESRRIYAEGLSWGFPQVYQPDTPAPFASIPTYVRSAGEAMVQLDEAFLSAADFMAARSAGDPAAIQAGVNGESPDEHRIGYIHITAAGAGSIQRGRARSGLDILEVRIDHWLETPRPAHPRLLALDADFVRPGDRQQRPSVLEAAILGGQAMSAAERVALSQADAM